MNERAAVNSREPAERSTHARPAHATGLPALDCATVENPSGEGLPALAWRCGEGWRMAATTIIGGGLGERHWVLNAQVPEGYERPDPDRHLCELAGALSLRGPGVGMLTAACIEYLTTRGEDGGVTVLATTGLGSRGLAASAERARTDAPGTINLIVAVPAALEDGALLNAIATATEAKSQALIQAGFPCTGTATDAVCVAALQAGPRAEFGGPRSGWGARIARAVHEAVLDGAITWIGGNPGVVDQLQPTDRFSPVANPATVHAATSTQ